jgi:hypothetical protein
MMLGLLGLKSKEINLSLLLTIFLPYNVAWKQLRKYKKIKNYMSNFKAFTTGYMMLIGLKARQTEIYESLPCGK